MLGRDPQGGYSREADPPLLGHLMACRPSQSRKATAGSVALSLLGHGALVTLAVWLTSLPARSNDAPPSRIVDITLPPDNVPAVPPPPAAQQPREEVVAAAALPPGSRTLEPPTVTLDYIPLPSPGVLTDESAYGGWGVIGGDPRGTARDSGRAASPEDVTLAPVFTPVAVAPVLQNRAEVLRALTRTYPPLLRDAGVGGRVLVWVLVDESGAAMKCVLKESSSYTLMDAAALDVCRAMRFSPGINADRKVKVWVAVPVEFRTSER